MEQVKVIAPSKINLSLDITGVDEKGYHLLLEKPMAIDLNDAKKIRDAALKSDRVLMISHQH